MSKGVTKMSDTVAEILRTAEVRDNEVHLTCGQLDRTTYSQVDKALRALGGKWNTRKKAHIFDGDPRAKLGQAVEDGEVTDQKKALSQFFTPPDVAQRMIDEAHLRPGGSCILEPSFGSGRILRALAETGPLNRYTITGYEIDAQLVADARKEFGTSANLSLKHCDFLQVNPARRFDHVLMNPPFDGGADIDHMIHALRFLRPSGYLVGICAGGPRQRAFFDQWVVESPASWWEDLPPATFKSEGTTVNTAMLCLRVPEQRPIAYTPPRKLENKATVPAPLPLLEMIAGR